MLGMSLLWLGSAASLIKLTVMCCGHVTAVRSVPILNDSHILPVDSDSLCRIFVYSI